MIVHQYLWKIIYNRQTNNHVIQIMYIIYESSAPECLARQAFYDLQLQLSTGTLQRDYMVLSHGWVSKQRHEIRAKVHWWNVLGLSNDPCQSGGLAQPPMSSWSREWRWWASGMVCFRNLKFGFHPIDILKRVETMEANPMITPDLSMVLI